jgi:hypothetical protein
MENQQQSDLLTNIGGEELAGSGFEMEVPTRLDEVTLESPTEESQEDAR